MSTEDQLTREFYEKWKTSPNNQSATVPSFYRRVTPNDQDIQFRLLEEARGMSLSRINARILDNEEIQEIWNLLQQYAEESPSRPEGKQYLSYGNFSQIRSQASTKIQVTFQ